MQKYKILIVDDDPQIRKILQRMLQQEIYETQLACDGNQAIEVMEQFKPQLVILDVMMPGMSGIEVCQKIRERYQPQQMRVLVLSAKDAQEQRLRALECGADEYVTKPFHIVALNQKITALLQA